ncbi:MAG: dephospho-CoA kinase [Epsilonproteobacteria bacterium]|nr:dephospho-CoA kinase [Campylobacterota bacterium]NPA56334.1 dephospho-CoA kinase [Campylobacterota bacterium]
MVELPHAIALTGGIATGKSTTANLLKLYGFHVIDADEIAHQVLEGEAESIARLFGEEFVVDGRVDRKRLGRLVFNDERELRKLEELLHPQIRRRIVEAALERERFGVPYIVDIPLFFEREGYPISRVAVVYAPREVQLRRLMERDNLDREEAERRIGLQMDIEKKRFLADYIIDNSGDLKNLQKEVEWFIERIGDDFRIG